MSCIASTESGKLQGLQQAGVDSYLGIPYAEAPVGALRFAPPQPAAAWQGVRPADAFGPDAPQPASLLGFDRSDNPQDEDCLTLNIWTPATDAGQRAVMVWIHGGGFSTGGSSRAMYDGAMLARHGDLVFVSINYRLGVLGLLTHPDLADEATGTSSNWALLDQRAALQWVQRNIAAFGGDPQRVTVFGESAGGASVGLQCASPGSAGLFQTAIVQSASPEPIPYAQSVEATEAFMEAAGVSAGPGLAGALRALEVETILEAHLAWAAVASRGRTAPRPCLDGVFLPESPDVAARNGVTAAFDLVVGSNRDEAKIFLFGDPRRGKLSEADLLRRVAAEIGSDEAGARQVIAGIRDARSQRKENSDPWEIYCALFTDRMIRVPALAFLEAHIEGGGQGRSYLFEWESPIEVLGACHGLEIPFCLGTLNTAEGMHGFAGSGADADRLMGRMRDFWVAIAHDDAAALADWPRYDATQRGSMRFGPESAAEDAPREPERALLAPLVEDSAHVG